MTMINPIFYIQTNHVFTMRVIIFILFGSLLLTSCWRKDEIANPMLRIKIKTDAELERLDSKGQVATVKTGNAAQTPLVKTISPGYIEFSQEAKTPLGKGFIAYQADQTRAGGEAAFDFSKCQLMKDGDVFLTIPLKELPKGTYQWVRASMAYQNADLIFNLINVPNLGELPDERGTLSVFTGFNTFISKHKIREKEETLNANKKFGYWAFETALDRGFVQHNTIKNGQAVGTSSVNPNYTVAPVPIGSGIVTGRFETPLIVTGSELQDVTVTLSLSTNQSFEWVDTHKNGKWDLDVQNFIAEPVIDAGFRNLKATIGNQ
jgi:nitrogen fixation protein FixH